MVTLTFAKFYLLFIFICTENFVCLAFSTAPFEGENPILGPQKFFKFYLSLIFTLLQQFMCLALKAKKFEFWRAGWGETSCCGAPSFC